MLIDSFLKYLQLEKAYSDKTIVSYRNDLIQFEMFFKEIDENLDYLVVDADIIRMWIISLMDQKYTSTSVNRKLSSLRSFYRFLLRKKVVKVNPLLKINGPKNKKKLPSFLREKDMDRLLDETSFGEGFAGDRDRLILEMFYETGIRLSELIGMNVDDVDFLNLQIKVTGKRNKQRIIPFGQELADDLKTYLRQRNETCSTGEEALFILENGKRMYPDSVYKIVKRNLSRVVSLKKRSPHVLRHTFATSMLNGQADLESVKELLGHQSLTTTEIYTHTTFEELKKVYKQAHPRA